MLTEKEFNHFEKIEKLNKLFDSGFLLNKDNYIEELYDELRLFLMTDSKMSYLDFSFYFYSTYKMLKNHSNINDLVLKKDQFKEDIALAILKNKKLSKDKPEFSYFVRGTFLNYFWFFLFKNNEQPKFNELFDKEASAEILYSCLKIMFGSEEELNNRASTKTIGTDFEKYMLKNIKRLIDFSVPVSEYNFNRISGLFSDVRLNNNIFEVAEGAIQQVQSIFEKKQISSETKNYKRRKSMSL